MPLAVFRGIATAVFVGGVVGTILGTLAARNSGRVTRVRALVGDAVRPGRSAAEHQAAT
jgi:hypothetical protein